MRVFISWSGHLSHQIACILRDWLPSVIQCIRPYVSSEDIDKGTRWSTDIAKELEAAQFGIICVTQGNLDAPWINFEAGALSKSIEKSNVAPFLFHVKRSEVKGPLLQFQSVLYEREELAKLLVSVNNRLTESERLKEDALNRAFEVWWPELKRLLDGLKDDSHGADSDAKHEKTHGAEILEEVLELARAQQRKLATPEDLLPPEYLLAVLDRVRIRGESHRPFAVERLHEEVLAIERLVGSLGESSLFPDELRVRISDLHDLIHRIRDPERARFEARSAHDPSIRGRALGRLYYEERTPHERSPQEMEEALARRRKRVIGPDGAS